MGSKGRFGAWPMKRSQSTVCGDASGGIVYCHAPSAGSGGAVAEGHAFHGHDACGGHEHHGHGHEHHGHEHHGH